ncbi:MAG TPA: ADOP family duplicated permease [Longimicrobiales bacterium]|nr:ADOP family duplicated permease [Longimicrobiales bacterium]
MSDARRTGPRLARWLLLRFFPEREGRAAVGDLDEEYGERRQRGRAGAGLWYWGQVLRSLGHGRALARRARRRSTGVRASASAGWGIDEVWMDVRYAVRGLAIRPLFTALAATTLGLGIGATAAVYSVVRTALLTPLPYAEPDALVQFWSEYSWNNPEFLLLRDDFPGFERVFAYTTLRLTLPDPDGGPARVVSAIESSAEIFATLGVPALLGRTLGPGDDMPEAAPVVVLGHDLWRTAYGADPSIVGQAIDVSGVRRTVVGVLPERFWFPDHEFELFLPRPLRSENQAGSLTLVGRLEGDRDAASMEGELAAITRVLGERFSYPDPRWDRTRDARLTPLDRALLGRSRPALHLALGATALILLIACANVSTMLLARLRARHAELALRSALGASRTRLARQLVTESVVLAGLAAVVGAAVAAGAFRVLVSTLPLVPGLRETLTLDWSMLGAGVGLALVAGLAAGLGPLAALAATDLRRGLLDRSGGGGSVGARLEGGLVVAEVALAVVLVTGAGLLIESVRRMHALDPGFDASGVIALDVVQGSGDFGMSERARNLIELARRAEALPGVVAAGSIQQLPLRGSGWNFGLRIEGQPEVEEATLYRMVTPGYFETMGIRVLRGRVFRDTDAPEDVPSVVINRTMAERYWPGEDPLGRRIGTGVDERWATVIGVVEDVRIGGFREPVRPARYMLAEQIAYTTDQHTLVVRTDDVGLARITELRALVGELDPRIAVARIDDMEGRVLEAMGEARELMILLTLLGAFALLLGALGTYGVVSHWVTRRSRTWGVLLALGSEPSRVVTHVLRRGGTLVLVGGVLGLGGSLLAARALRGFLYEVSPTDPAALAVAVLTLVGSGLLAAWLPARRAARTDPLTVLNQP